MPRARPFLGRAAAAAGAGLALAVAGGASGQEGDGSGPRYALVLSNELRFSDNPGFDGSADPGAWLRATADLSIDSETRTQSLSLGLSVTAVEGFGTDAIEDRVLGPDLRLDYARRASRAELSLSASLRTRDLDLDPVLPVLDPVDGDGDGDGDGDAADGGTDGGVGDTPLTAPEDLIAEGGGLRRDTRLRAALRTGIDTPLELSFSAGLRRTDYEGTDDPDLQDERTLDLNAAAALEFAPPLTGRISVGASRNEEGGETTDRLSARLGLDWTPTDRLGASASIGRSLIERSSGGDAATLTFALGLSYALPRGAVTLDYDRRLDGDLAVDRLRLGRTVELNEVDRLAWSLGYERAESGEDGLTGTLSLRRALPRGTLSARLTRALEVDLDEGTLITTSGALNLSRRLNAAATLSLGLEHRALDGGAEDEEATTLRGTLSYELDADWRLRGGIEHGRRSDGDGSRDRTAVFVSLDRAFEGLF
ncbi:MAG: hypothetical protein ACU0BS_03795 [Hasllibacter sp.]